MCFINDFLFCREKIIINDFVLIIFLCRMFFYIISYVFPSQTPHYDCAAMYGWGAGGGSGGPQLGPMMPRDARADIRLIAVVSSVWKHAIKVAMCSEK